MKYKNFKKTFTYLFLVSTLIFSIFSCKNESNNENIKNSEEAEEEIIETITVEGELADDFTISKVFTDNMVLQRNEKIRIFGWADTSENGKKITADFMGMHSESLIKKGAWEITFPHGVKESIEENTLEVKSKTQTYTFENVLIGDVYMVIGQSNVAYTVQQHWGYLNNELSFNDALAKGDSTILNENAPIRINYNGLDQYIDQYKSGSSDVCKEPMASNYKGWQLPSLENIAPFSALGYYFAHNYQRFTNSKVPVGLIEINGNGKPIGCFLPNKVANQTQSDTLDEKTGIYHTIGSNGNELGRYLYNQFMYPFEHYALAGVIWYQGESDWESPQLENYTKRFTGLIKYMRTTHNVTNKNFPVYIVELPSVYSKPSTYTDNWPYIPFGKIRGVIGAIPTTLNNTYLSVSCDLWNDKTYNDNIHPNCKFEQTERLAKIVCAVNNEKGTLDEVSGPIIQSITYSTDNKSATLTFTNIGTGLQTSDNSSEVKGFLVLSNLYTPNTDCTAKITSKNTIKITCETEIQGIAYNVIEENFYGIDITLCDSYGNPAGSFMISELPTT